MDFIIVNDVLVEYRGNDTNVTIPDSVTSIGESAFEGCSSLKSITLPDSVTNIGDYAFYECKSLKSITLSDGVTGIGNYAFEWCKSLTSINIPDSVTSIGEYAFVACSSLKSITLTDSVTSIGNNAFYACYNLEELIITIDKHKLTVNVAGIKKVGDYAYTILKMFYEKDFSVRLNSDVKYKLIADYFFCSADKDAETYMKKNALKMIRLFIENGDTDRIKKILEKTDFVTKRNIEKLCTHASDNNMQEIYDILTDYRNKNF